MGEVDKRLEAARKAARSALGTYVDEQHADSVADVVLSAADAIEAEDGRSREIWEIPELGLSHWLAEDVPHFSREIPKTGAALLLAMDDRRVVGLRWSPGAPISAAPSPEGGS